MAVTPAGAEVSSAVATNWKKIWKKNLKPLADKRYYTKAQSNTKYATKAESADAAAGATTAANASTDTKLADYYKKADGDAKYLPKRTLLTGVWASGAITAGAQPVVAINFGATASAAPTAAVYRAPGSVANTQCPGSADAPDAAPGILCVYSVQNLNFATHYFFNLRGDGAVMAATSSSNTSYMYGNWAFRPLGYAAAARVVPSPDVQSLTGTDAGR